MSFMINKRKKESKKTVVIPKGDETRYLISSLEYELRMIESIREKDIKKKKIIPKILT